MLHFTKCPHYHSRDALNCVTDSSTITPLPVYGLELLEYTTLIVHNNRGVRTKEVRRHATATIQCYGSPTRATVPALCFTSRCGYCSVMWNDHANNPSYGHNFFLRMPATAVTLCCGCLLRPLRRATDACYGRYAVLWVPATAITSCYGCLLRPLRYCCTQAITPCWDCFNVFTGLTHHCCQCQKGMTFVSWEQIYPSWNDYFNISNTCFYLSRYCCRLIKATSFVTALVSVGLIALRTHMTSFDQDDISTDEVALIRRRTFLLR